MVLTKDQREAAVKLVEARIAKVFQSANIGGRDRVDEAAVARALAQAREAERMKRVSDQHRE